MPQPVTVPQAAVPAAQPAPLAASVADSGLQHLVENAIDTTNGSTAVAVRNLRTGASAAYHDHDVFPAASVAKVPILVEVYRRLDTGTLHLDDQVAVTSEAITGGAGVLQAREGDKLTVGELLQLSVTVSDNVAARLLMNQVGGTEGVNKTMASMGLAQTRLYSDDHPNTTTAAEMGTLLATLATRGGAAGSAPVSPAGQSAAARGNPLAGGAAPASAAPALVPSEPAANTLMNLLALPQAQAWVAAGLPKSVTVAHKSGQLPGVRNEAAVVYAPRGAYVIVGLTNDLADQDDAETFLTGLSRQVFDYFANK